MLDLSMNIMDMIENSVSADATEISVLIEMIVLKNKLHINIKDNGKGMDEELIKMVQNPFFTTKTYRKKKVGLGIPLFKQNVEICNGRFNLISKTGVGTEIDAVMQYDHIDRMPLGKLSDTFSSVVISHSEVDFELNLRRIFLDNSENGYHFSSKEVKKELGDLPITYPDVMQFIIQHIFEGIKKIKLEEI